MFSPHFAEDDYSLGYLKLEQLEENISDELDKCGSLKEIFGLVQDCVKETLKQSRAGLDIGLAELGNQPDGLLGAYYPVGSNIIVINATPLKRIMETKPELFKPYLFAVLLHEYIHSLGYFDELTTRRLSHAICSRLFGDDHAATQVSADMRTFFPYLLYPGGRPASNRMEVIEVEEADYIG